MSKIRCFIGNHKTFENFTGTLIIRLCGDFDHKIYGDFDHKIYGDFNHKIYRDSTGDFVHKTFEDFFVVLYRYIVIFCYI